MAIYAIGTSLDEGPGTSLDLYRSAATVIPTLLVAVAIQGRVLELSTKITFARRYRTVMLAVVVFGGETGALMTIAREETNRAAHLYVHLALISLGLLLLYLALVGPDRFKETEKEPWRLGPTALAGDHYRPCGCAAKPTGWTVHSALISPSVPKAVRSRRLSLTA